MEQETVGSDFKTTVTTYISQHHKQILINSTVGKSCPAGSFPYFLKLNQFCEAFLKY